MNQTTARIRKGWVGIGLSLTLFFAGSFHTAPITAYAAEAVQPASTTMSISSTTSKANAILATGKALIGVPYKYGSPAGQTKTFDCSSFTQYVFKKNGITLPRSSRDQSKVGTYVPRSQLKAGDLVFFYSPIHHVGIYMGNGLVLHTYGTPGVTISSMKSGWWSRNYTTARRVIR